MNPLYAITEGYTYSYNNVPWGYRYKHESNIEHKMQKKNWESLSSTCFHHMRSTCDMWNGSVQELLISPTGLHSSFAAPREHGRGGVRSKHDLAFIECEMNAMRLLRYLQQCSIHAVALIFHSAKIPTKTKRPPTANIPLSPKHGASSRQH